MTTPTLKLITVQPSAFVDQMVVVDRDESDEDYHPDTDSSEILELTRLPYPFHVWEDGLIHRQEFWQGRPLRVVGFAARFDREQIDLWWSHAADDPEKAIGMYVVTQNRDNTMATHQTAIASVEVHMVDATYRTIDEEAAKP
jgi:hypothetical protein